MPDARWPTEWRVRTCTECGALVKPAEFHPYEFCVLVKARQDPWDLVRRAADVAGYMRPKVAKKMRTALEAWEKLMTTPSALDETGRELVVDSAAVDRANRLMREALAADRGGERRQRPVDDVAGAWEGREDLARAIEEMRDD